MNYQGKTKEELIYELKELHKKYNSLKISTEADTRERKLEEELLQESDEKFRRLFNEAPLGYQSLDIDGCFVEVNQQWLEVLGFEREEVIGKWFGDFLAPAYKDHFRKRFPIFKEQGHIRSEFEMVHKNGKLIFVAFDGKIGFDLKGNFKQTHCIIKDISDQKHAENTLSKSEKRFRSYVNYAPHGVFIVDKNGNYVEANPAACKITGYNREEVLLMNLRDLVIPELLESADNHFNRVVNEGFASGEAVFIRKDGSKGFWTIDAVKLSDDRFLGFVVDITGRRQAEKKLKESEEKYRKMVENMNSGVVIYQAINNGKDFKFLDFNRAAERITNSSAKDVVGHTLLNKFPNMDKSPLFKALQSVYKSGKDLHLPPFFYKDKDRQGWRENYLYKLPSGEIVAIFEDITKRKNAERELIKSKEKAEESDRLKSAFLSNMSHEIRTPMNGILGFAGLLKNHHLSSDQQQYYISIIEKSGARMLNIINDIVDISKIESGLMELNMAESNINEQVEYIYTFFKPDVEAKGIDFSFKNTLSNKEELITTDREKVFAILTNLVKNAIKYTKDGYIEFGYEKKGKFLEFFVKDSGIGIPIDRQKAVFERFIQADIENEMARQGAGLGLSITKAYIEMLGGEIWLESKQGKGSIFYFTIPYNNILEDTIIIENIVNKDDKFSKLNPKILIVEDDETSQFLLQAVCEVFSDDILLARSGEEAIEICRINPDIDVILMDIRMPGMGGIKAVKQIRKINKEVFILAQTAYVLREDKERIMESGFNDYISKPINQDELLEKIKKHFAISK